MNWLRRAPSAEVLSVKEALKQAEAQREKRRMALKALVRALDELPLDDGLVKVGDDIARTPKGDH